MTTTTLEKLSALASEGVRTSGSHLWRRLDEVLKAIQSEIRKTDGDPARVAKLIRQANATARNLRQAGLIATNVTARKSEPKIMPSVGFAVNRSPGSLALSPCPDEATAGMIRTANGDATPADLGLSELTANMIGESNAPAFVY